MRAFMKSGVLWLQPLFEPAQTTVVSIADVTVTTGNVNACVAESSVEAMVRPEDLTLDVGDEPNANTAPNNTDVEVC